MSFALGELVSAKWTDNNYYPARIEEKIGGDKWFVVYPQYGESLVVSTEHIKKKKGKIYARKPTRSFKPRPSGKSPDIFKFKVTEHKKTLIVVVYIKSKEIDLISIRRGRAIKKTVPFASVTLTESKNDKTEVQINCSVQPSFKKTLRFERAYSCTHFCDLIAPKVKLGECRLGKVNLSFKANNPSNSRMQLKTVHGNKFFRKARGLVSQQKRRFQEDGFDLDLSYITERIIAMGFPSDNSEKLFRNPYQEVLRFFEKYHIHRYKVYNLATERQYVDENKFPTGRFCHYPFDDHNPPPFNLILPFCKDVHNFLSENENNVVAIHCKAGKGRTGTCIAAYLVYTGIIANAEKALLYFAQNRTWNSKGVTIPSQQRYVYYFAQYINNCYALNQQPSELVYPLMKLNFVQMKPAPRMSGGCAPFLVIHGPHPEREEKYNFRDDQGKDAIPDGYESTMSTVRFKVQKLFRGDLKFLFYDSGRNKKGKEYMFHFWVNTYFLPKKQKYKVDIPEGVPIRRSPVMEDEMLTDEMLEHGTVIRGIVVRNWLKHSRGFSQISHKDTKFLTPVSEYGIQPGEMTSGKNLILHKSVLDEAHKDKYNLKYKKKFYVELSWDVPTQDECNQI